MVRAAGLRVQGVTVTAGGQVPSAGELIGAAVDAALAEGRLRPRQRWRIMSYPLVIRLMIAMTPRPDAPCCEALRGVAGLLADIPFTREWHVPDGKSGHGLTAACSVPDFPNDQWFVT